MPEAANEPAYQFGDSDLAAERLRRLAAVFDPSSREFLATLVPAAPRAIVDLGCGPGWTTRLVAETFPAADVLGVDSSASFVNLAGSAHHSRVRFEVADVTRPLIGGPFDLIYCRYLLTHLPEAATVIDRWSAHLRPGGLVAIEENEWIQTDEPAFAKYLNIVEAMLADSGQMLYVSAELARIEHWPSLVQRSSEVVPIAARNRDAAGMFLPNLHGWRSRPFVEQNYSAAELDKLHDDLEQLANDRSDNSSITFGRRRLVLAHPRP